MERFVYSPYGVLTFYDATWANIRSASSYAADYTYTGRRSDRETGLYYYRHRVLHSQLGRFSSRDLVKTHANLLCYCRDNPVKCVDYSGKWGEDVHYGSTKQWAMAVGFTEQAASDMAAADKNTDGLMGGTAPIPIFGDQDYHFNGNRTGADTRDAILSAYIAEAKRLASQPPTPGNLIRVRVIATHVGIALHAKQDWVAHADYGYRVPMGQDIWIIHNSRSPQRTFGTPGDYPDDPTLDVIGSPDGRATIPYLWATWGWSWFHIQDAEYACYQKGTKRIVLTENITKQILIDFRQFLEGNNVSDDVRDYFLGH